MQTIDVPRPHRPWIEVLLIKSFILCPFSSSLVSHLFVSAASGTNLSQKRAHTQLREELERRVCNLYKAIQGTEFREREFQTNLASDRAQNFCSRVLRWATLKTFSREQLSATAKPLYGKKDNGGDAREQSTIGNRHRQSECKPARGTGRYTHTHKRKNKILTNFH